jgi:HNH endonuclease
MAALPLTQDRIALVDSADLPLLTRWRWEFLPNGRSGYAVRRLRANGQTITIYLHRQLLNARPGELVDHADGDGLNCRRENLRLATVAENAANRPARPRDIPYRGVYRSRAGQKPYKAMITIAGRCKHLGWFARQEDAARAYDVAAYAAFGRFARLNFADRLLPDVEQLALPFDQADDWIEPADLPVPRPRPTWDEGQYMQRLARPAAPALADDWDKDLL